MTDLTQEPQQQEIKSACVRNLERPIGLPERDVQWRESLDFCNHASLKAFLSAPEAFMAGEVEHPLEDEASES